MSLHESGEDYLEAILMLREKNGSVRSIDVVQHLGYSKPSISRAMSILRTNGYITMESDGRLLLTTEGEAGNCHPGAGAAHAALLPAYGPGRGGGHCQRGRLPH